ncbi:solute carrier family 43 member 3-like [Megalops cyprinoides]|uniref:solute carrier family 43 member 3-like n=1 Tax=Megalops cyprinoides TaxID=118141 RepID=UPI0018648F4E|nr:solute carrier family 43 member 3-like [Megalops cyprinoides]
MLRCQVGDALRWLSLLTGILESLCFTALINGWPSLVIVLKRDGYFGDFCTNATAANGSVYTDCSGQDVQLSLIFSIASTGCKLFTLPIGFIFDRFGTMATRLLAVLLYTISTLMVAFSTAELSVLLYPAMFTIAVVGSMLYVTNVQVGNLFGSHRSTVISLNAGASNSSPVIFLIIEVLNGVGVSLRSSFLFLAASSVILLLRTFFLMPKTHIPYPLPENYMYRWTSCGQSNSPEQQEAGRMDNTGTTQSDVHVQSAPSLKEDTQPSENPPVNIKSSGIGTQASPLASFVSEASLRSCVLSWFFLFHLLWYSLMQLNLCFFIGTLNPMLSRLADGDSTLVNNYTSAFGLAQLLPVFLSPINGMLIDRIKGKKRVSGETEKEADLRSSILSLFLTTIICVLFSICVSIPVLPLQYLSFLLNVLCFSFLSGSHSTFLTVAFPSCHYGMLYGLIAALTAVVLMLQSPLLIIINAFLEGDPLYVNIALTFLTLLTFIHPLYTRLYCRKRAACRQGSAAS